MFLVVFLVVMKVPVPKLKMVAAALRRNDSVVVLDDGNTMRIMTDIEFAVCLNEHRHLLRKRA